MNRKERRMMEKQRKVETVDDLETLINVVQAKAIVDYRKKMQERSKNKMRRASRNKARS
jgi:hypothetical protein